MSQLHIRVSMILPQDQLDSITTEINKGQHGIQTTKSSLTNIKVEDSEASVRLEVIVMICDITMEVQIITSPIRYHDGSTLSWPRDYISPYLYHDGITNHYRQCD